MRYAQRYNAAAEEASGQLALVTAWAAVVEIAFTRRCVNDTVILLPRLVQIARDPSYIVGRGQDHLFGVSRGATTSS